MRNKHNSQIIIHLKKKSPFNQEIPQLQVCVLRMGPVCWLCSLEWASTLLSKSSWPGFLHPGKDTMKDLMVTSSAKVSSLFTPSSLCISNSTFFFGVCVWGHQSFNYSLMNIYIQIFLPVGREAGWHGWGSRPLIR